MGVQRERASSLHSVHPKIMFADIQQFVEGGEQFESLDKYWDALFRKVSKKNNYRWKKMAAYSNRCNRKVASKRGGFAKMVKNCYNPEAKFNSNPMETLPVRVLETAVATRPPGQAPGPRPRHEHREVPLE